MSRSNLEGLDAYISQFEEVNGVVSLPHTQDNGARFEQYLRPHRSGSEQPPAQVNSVRGLLSLFSPTHACLHRSHASIVNEFDSARSCPFMRQQVLSPYISPRQQTHFSVTRYKSPP
jgi:hypothetical protein